MLCLIKLFKQYFNHRFHFRSNISLASELQNGLPEADMNFKPIRDDLNK